MTTKVQLRRVIDGGMEDVNPMTSEECVMLEDGKKLKEVVDFVVTTEDFEDEDFIVEENLVDRVESIENRIDSEFEQQNSQIATGLSNIKTVEQNISNKVDTEVAKVNAQLSNVKNNLQTQINNLVLESGGDSNLEVIQARGDFSTLNGRISSIEELVQDGTSIRALNIEFEQGALHSSDGAELESSKNIRSKNFITFTNKFTVSTPEDDAYRCTVFFFDENKVKVGHQSVYADNTPLSFNNDYAYYRFIIWKTDGGTVTIADKDKLEVTISVKTQMIANKEEIEKINAILLKLKNKKISLDGDSICYGAGFTGGYGKLLADDYGMIVQNLAISGGTVTTGTTTSNGSNRHWISESVKNLDNNSDYYLIEGGYNDYGNSVELGSITTKYNSTLDISTFYGAMESLCRTLVTNHRGKKIGYLIPHKINTVDTDKYPTYTFLDYKNAIKEVCKKYAIPVLDLSEVSNMCTGIDVIKTEFTTADGIHPNEAGYRVYYICKIVEFLLSL